MSEPKWEQIIEDAHRNPSMRLGRPNRAHISDGIEVPLRQCFVTRSLRDVDRVVVSVGHRSATVLAIGGALDPLIASETLFEKAENLIPELWRVTSLLLDRRDSKTMSLFRGDTGLSGGSNAFCLASWGVLGVRAGDKMWVQSFAEGLPIYPLASAEVSDLGFIQCICFDEAFFTGLPFQERDVNHAISPTFDEYRHRIRLERALPVMDHKSPPKWLFRPEDVVDAVQNGASCSTIKRGPHGC